MELELAILTLIVGFIGTVIGVVVTTGIARKQLQQNNHHLEKQITHSIELAEKQEKQTEKITVMTSDLEARVNRLSVGLNHRIETLHRLRDVILKLVECNIVMYLQREIEYAERIHVHKPNKDVSSDDVAVQHFKNDLEMRAVAQVINDPTLNDTIEAYTEYTKFFDQETNKGPIGKLYEHQNRKNDYYSTMLGRIYELIEKTIQS